MSTKFSYCYCGWKLMEAGGYCYWWGCVETTLVFARNFDFGWSYCWD